MRWHKIRWDEAKRDEMRSDEIRRDQIDETDETDRQIYIHYLGVPDFTGTKWWGPAAHYPCHLYKSKCQAPRRTANNYQIERKNKSMQSGCGSSPKVQAVLLVFLQTQFWLQHISQTSPRHDSVSHPRCSMISFSVINHVQLVPLHGQDLSTHVHQVDLRRKMSALREHIGRLVLETLEATSFQAV